MRCTIVRPKGNAEMFTGESPGIPVGDLLQALADAPVSA